MLVKHPKGQIRGFLRKGITGLLIFEAVCFVGGYIGWYKTNTDREFRYYLHQNIPSALNFYYKTGEIIEGDKNNAREIDLAYWEAQGRKI